MRIAAKLLALPLLALAACSGGGGGSNGGDDTGSVNQPPIATPTPDPTPTPAPFPTPTPTPGDFFTRAAALYTSPPDIAACQAGQLNATTTTTVLQTLNALRALHRLPPVTYSAGDEPGAQQAALMMAANAQLSHSPPASWLCYTAAGAAAASSSNLYGGTGTGLSFQTDEQILAGWLTEINNIAVESVGHRRWLLDPFLGAVAYGRVAGRYQTSNRADAAAIKVFNTTGSGIVNGALPPYVAYPYQDYPARFFDARALLSFSAISNISSKFANSNVNFANATVTVRQRDGAALTVSRIAYDNDGYGLPNNLQFFASGIQAGVIYNVTINNVSIGGTATNYSYWFRILP